MEVICGADFSYADLRLRVRTWFVRVLFMRGRTKSALRLGGPVLPAVPAAAEPEGNVD